MPKSSVVTPQDLQPVPALTDDDYYMTPDGLLVFTAAYHQKRGYCCRNGCRHCPFGCKKARE